jgi:hypothetical protein
MCASDAKYEEQITRVPAEQIDCTTVSIKIIGHSDMPRLATPEEL